MVDLLESVPFQTLQAGDAFLLFNRLYIKVNAFSARPEDEDEPQEFDNPFVSPVEIF